MIPVIWLIQSRDITQEEKVLLIPALIIVVTTAWFIDIAPGWYLFSWPYDYIVGYYYYTLYVPIAFTKTIFQWFDGFTSFGNLNLVISLIASILYIWGMIWGSYRLAKLLGKFRGGYLILTILSIGPLALALILKALGWLFS